MNYFTRAAALAALTCIGLGPLAASGKQETSPQETAPTQVQKLTVCVPKAPPALPVLRMIDTNALGDAVEIELAIWDLPEQLIAMVQDQKNPIFAFPLTVFAKLYNKGMDIRLTNVNTWGVTYFLTKDTALDSWDDLKGKTVYIPLKSSPPDILTQFFLKRAGLDPASDVNIVYSTTTEIGQLMKAGTIDYATQIEPMVTAITMGNSQVRVAFDFEEEWQKIQDSEAMLPNAGMGIRGAFAKENPETARHFEKAYQEALEWLIENPAEAGALAEKYLGLNAAMVSRSLPTSGFTYRSAMDSRKEIKELYTLLLDFDPATIGGKIPDDLMFYQ